MAIETSISFRNAIILKRLLEKHALIGGECMYVHDLGMVMSSYLASLATLRFQPDHNQIRYTHNLLEIVDILLKHGASPTYEIPDRSVMKDFGVDILSDGIPGIPPTPILMSLVHVNSLGVEVFLKLHHRFLEIERNDPVRCAIRCHDINFLHVAAIRGSIPAFREVLRRTITRSCKDGDSFVACKCYDARSGDQHPDHNNRRWFMWVRTRLMMDAIVNMVEHRGAKKCMDIFDIFMDSGVNVGIKCDYESVGNIPEGSYSVTDVLNLLVRQNATTELIRERIRTYPQRAKLKSIAFMHI